MIKNLFEHVNTPCWGSFKHKTSVNCEHRDRTGSRDRAKTSMVIPKSSSRKDLQVNTIRTIPVTPRLYYEKRVVHVVNQQIPAFQPLYHSGVRSQRASTSPVMNEERSCLRNFKDGFFVI
jgi:hypothetical protein